MACSLSCVRPLRLDGLQRDRLLSVLIAALGLSLAGCVPVTERNTAETWVSVGNQAELRGDWDTARAAWQGAVASEQRRPLTARARAVLELNYGRTLGVTCRFDEAESHLLNAWRLDRDSGGPVQVALLELGRLTFDQRKYDASAQYFDEALVAIQRAGIPARAPAEFANVLDEYAIALAGAERATEAAAVWQQAAELRRKDPTLSVIADRTPYGSQCGLPDLPTGSTPPRERR